MAKKKPRLEPKPAPAKAPPTNFGTLGDLLGKPAKPAPRARFEPPPPPPPPPAPERPQVREVTEDDLMREAFDAARVERLYAGKYEGIGFDVGNVIVVRPTPEAIVGPSSRTGAVPTDRPEVTPEDLMFFDAMSDVTAAPPANRLSERLANHDWTGARWADRVELVSLSASDLHEPTLTHEQRQLLRRSRNETIAVLNIRLQRREDAMREVEVFVRTCARRNLRFVRIITGKGRHSVGGEPVLKPAVIRWCGEAGVSWVRAWAPETDRSGNYGSVVLELRENVS